MEILKKRPYLTFAPAVVAYALLIPATLIIGEIVRVRYVPQGGEDLTGIGWLVVIVGVIINSVIAAIFGGVVLAIGRLINKKFDKNWALMGAGIVFTLVAIPIVAYTVFFTIGDYHAVFGLVRYHLV